MLDAIDSHYRHVLSRMKTISPQRQVLGVVDALDWPPKTVRFESFYLVVLGPSPLGRSFDSAAVPVVEHILQWVWMILGTDLQKGVIGRNRGDRYRVSMSMKEEIVKALYPRFTEKKSWSITGNSPGRIPLSSQSLDPVEYVWWTPPVFAPRINLDSGVEYGAASIRLVEMTDAIAA